MCATVLEARREELSAADPEFAAIRAAGAHLQFTETWIRDYSDGLAIDDWLLKELIKMAIDLHKSTKPLQVRTATAVVRVR